MRVAVDQAATAGLVHPRHGRRWVDVGVGIAEGLLAFLAPSLARLPNVSRLFLANRQGVGQELLLPAAAGFFLGRLEGKGREQGARRQPTPQQLCELRARIGMVFQSYNLWPHMTVLENVIEAPIRVRRMPRRQAVAEAEALLQRIGLYEKRHAYP